MHALVGVRAVIAVTLRARELVELGEGWNVVVSLGPVQDPNQLLVETQTRGAVGVHSFPVASLGPKTPWAQDIPVDLRFINLPPIKVAIMLSFAGVWATDSHVNAPSILLPVHEESLDVLDFARSYSEDVDGGSLAPMMPPNADFFPTRRELDVCVRDIFKNRMAENVIPPPAQHVGRIKFSMQPSSAGGGPKHAYRRCLATLLAGGLEEDELRKCVRTSEHAVIIVPTTNVAVSITLRMAGDWNTTPINVELSVRTADEVAGMMVEEALLKRMEEFEVIFIAIPHSHKHELSEKRPRHLTAIPADTIASLERDFRALVSLTEGGEVSRESIEVEGRLNSAGREAINAWREEVAGIHMGLFEF
ncbi:hypothetical protein HK104_010086 [Borealophlyctis nickersoniae]|nr:hypothetical protein HK104_010086 [Borealophlyctis nickersoniae]